MEFIIPSFPSQNLLAFADKEPAYTVTVDVAPDFYTIGEAFDGQAGTYAQWNAASLPVTIQIDYDQRYNLQHLFGVGFYTQVAKDVKIEAYDNNASAWVTILEITDQVYSSVLVAAFQNYVTKVKFTLDNAAAAVIRLTHLLDATTHSIKGYYASKGSEQFLGNVDVPSFRIRDIKTPASAAASGTKGDICWDASYIYICVDTNTWERAAIASW